MSGRTGRPRAGRNDENHTLILQTVIDEGASAVSTSTIGNGFGDIIAAINWHTFMFEVKNPNAPPSKRRLTPAEKEFHRTWKGRIHLVETPEDARIVVRHYAAI